MNYSTLTDNRYRFVTVFKMFGVKIKYINNIYKMYTRIIQWYVHLPFEKILFTVNWVMYGI